MSLTYASGVDVVVDVVVPPDVVVVVVGVVTVEGDVGESAPPPHATNTTPAVQSAAAVATKRVDERVKMLNIPALVSNDCSGSAHQAADDPSLAASSIVNSVVLIECQQHVGCARHDPRRRRRTRDSRSAPIASGARAF